jgi:flagellar hook-associated protein 3 FlgL
MMAEQSLNYINQNIERLNDLTIKSASMKAFQTVSDDPADATAAMTIKSSIQSGQNYLSNANDINSWMSMSDQAFSDMSKLLINAQTKVESGLTDTMSAEERQNSLAPELDTMLQEMLDLSNSTYMDRYIFSGYQVNTKPFSLSTTDPNTVNYNGDGGLMQLDIGTGQTMTMNINNSAVFTSTFSAIIRARNALQTNNLTELNASLTDIQTSINSVNDLTSTNGARQRQVKSVINHLEKSNLTLKSLLSKKEDANMAEVAVMLANQQTVYEAVLDVGKRAISLVNLFDILQ